MAQTWPTDAESYQIEAKIGKGAFATVYRAKWKKSETPCALKLLDLDGAIGANFVDIQQEVQTMRLSSHPNVLVLYTSFVHGSNLWLVTQLCSKGSSLRCINALRILQGRSSGGLESEDHITYILHETLKGLRYFHDNGHIHRDIKAGNILLDGESGDVRIADFGVAGWLYNAGVGRSNTKTFVGTPCWMAPEVMEQVNGYDYKADIWSLGITALELAKGHAPYAMYAPMKVLLLTIQEDPPSFETYNDNDDTDKWSKSFRDVINLCLQKDPKKRPSCEQLLLHRQFKGFSNEEFSSLRRKQIVEELCNVIDDVGEGAMGVSGDQRRPPGSAPIRIMSDAEGDRPKGTTWVFSDGSQVLASSSTKAFENNNEFFDEFERQTTRIKDIAESDTHKVQEIERQRMIEEEAEKRRREKEEKKKEMNDFFDEFERSTGGENFRTTNAAR